VQGADHSQQGPRILGQRIPRPCSRSGGVPEPTRVRTIPRTLPLPAQAETRCCHVVDCRDISQRAEPDVRFLGRASSAFIAYKTHRLTGDVPPRHLMYPVHSTGRDVPPRHLMCHVHSAGRRQPDHPACDMLVHSVGRQYTRVAECTMLIITHTSPGKLPLHANATQAADIRTRRLHWQQALVAPSIKSVMFVGPHVGA
jgi:hypothetical protein